TAGLQFCIPAFCTWFIFLVCGCGSLWILGILWRASCGMGNFRQIRGLYRTAQLVLTERDDYDPSHCLDLRRNYSRCSAAVGMADADRGSVKWSVASIVRSYDGGSSGNQGSFGLLSILREWRSFCTSRLHRLSIQHRSTTTRFVWTSVGSLDLSGSDRSQIVSSPNARRRRHRAEGARQDHQCVCAREQAHYHSQAVVYVER